jgi:serine/threonine protein phosphatase 1
MIYVLSDIHGNERRFGSILKQIDLKPEDTLYVLGDVMDRHGGGIRILRRLMGMPNAKLILGNHEYMMLRALGEPVDDNYDDGTAMPHWYRNGGNVTHEQWKILPDMYQRTMIRYLRNLPLNREVRVGEKRYLLVHGAPEELWKENEDPRYVSQAHFAVWKRLEEMPVMPEGTILIFGHTPTRYYQDNVPMEVYFTENCIGIDCGCGYPEGSEGRLACLRLDDGKIFYSEERHA